MRCAIFWKNTPAETKFSLQKQRYFKTRRFDAAFFCVLMYFAAVGFVLGYIIITEKESVGAMFFDSHLHTRFSADSEMTAPEALTAANKLGLGLVFTEHIDFSYPGELDFVFSPEEYWAAYEPLRGDYLRLGVELGLVPGETEKARQFIARAPFDEVIGSIHLVDGRDLYDPSSYEGREQKEMYASYLRLMAKMVRENPYIDVLGHIDYIARYAPYERSELCYEDYPQEVDEVFRALIETDTVLEINTRRFNDAGAVKNLRVLYQRYQKMGGEYITVGSDAHQSEAIGAHFSLAKEMAESCGLTPITFQARQKTKIF